MTAEEAIEELSNELRIITDMISYCRNFENCNDMSLAYRIKRKEAMETAIFALKEIQQYREIGTVEEWREAREKQTPKTDKFRLEISGALNIPCPNCGKCVELHKKGVIYCDNCGQAILDD